METTNRPVVVTKRAAVGYPGVSILNSLDRIAKHPHIFHKKITVYCSITFCFSFEVLKTLNPIQVNIKGGGPS